MRLLVNFNPPVKRGRGIVSEAPPSLRGNPPGLGWGLTKRSQMRIIGLAASYITPPSLRNIDPYSLFTPTQRIYIAVRAMLTINRITETAAPCPKTPCYQP